MISGGRRTRGIFRDGFPDRPLVTIITVVFNRARYLEQTLLSVLNQSYNNIEYVIIDGGSKDGTLDIIKKYNDRIDYWISEPDKGMYYALNKGIALSTGELIGICHSDDYYYSNDIIQYLVNIHKVVRADVYHGDAVQILESSNDVKYLPIKSKSELILETHNSIIHPTTYITKDAFNKFGSYNTRYKSASDYELMIRLMKNGCKFYHLEKIISGIRIINSDRVSNNCFGHIEAYSIHKYHKTGNQNKYLSGYLNCCARHIFKMIIVFLKLRTPK